VTGLQRNATPDWIERHASVLGQFFRTAREADPRRSCTFNDYSILETGGADSPHQDHFERTIRQLLDGQSPSRRHRHPRGISAKTSRIFHACGKSLIAMRNWGCRFRLQSSMSIRHDERLAGDYTRDFLTAMFAHESVNGRDHLGLLGETSLDPERCTLPR
jgi:hypothetical protein